MSQITSPDAAAEFVMRLIIAGDHAHVLHFKTRSYAQHIALGAFYTEIEELLDTLAESIQGKVGILDYPTDMQIPLAASPIKFLRELNEYVQEKREEVSAETDVQNLIDEIVTLISQTYYKIETLS